MFKAISFAVCFCVFLGLYSPLYATTTTADLCPPSLSTEQCLINIAKKVIETGKAMFYNGDSIDVDKASRILEKAGIK